MASLNSFQMQVPTCFCGKPAVVLESTNGETIYECHFTSYRQLPLSPQPTGRAHIHNNQQVHSSNHFNTGSSFRPSSRGQDCDLLFSTNNLLNAGEHNRTAFNEPTLSEGEDDFDSLLAELPKVASEVLRGKMATNSRTTFMAASRITPEASFSFSDLHVDPTIAHGHPHPVCGFHVHACAWERALALMLIRLQKGVSEFLPEVSSQSFVIRTHLDHVASMQYGRQVTSEDRRLLAQMILEIQGVGCAVFNTTMSLWFNTAQFDQPLATFNSVPCGCGHPMRIARISGPKLVLVCAEATSLFGAGCKTVSPLMGRAFDVRLTPIHPTKSVGTYSRPVYKDGGNHASRSILACDQNRVKDGSDKRSPDCAPHVANELPRADANEVGYVGFPQSMHPDGEHLLSLPLSLQHVRSNSTSSSSCCAWSAASSITRGDTVDAKHSFETETAETAPPQQPEQQQRQTGFFDSNIGSNVAIHDDIHLHYEGETHSSATAQSPHTEEEEQQAQEQVPPALDDTLWPNEQTGAQARMKQEGESDGEEQVGKAIPALVVATTSTSSVKGGKGQKTHLSCPSDKLSAESSSATSSPPPGSTSDLSSIVAPPPTITVSPAQDFKALLDFNSSQENPMLASQVLWEKNKARKLALREALARQEEQDVESATKLRVINLRLSMLLDMKGRLLAHVAKMQAEGHDNPEMVCRFCPKEGDENYRPGEHPGELESAVKPCWHAGACDKCILASPTCLTCGGVRESMRRIYWG